MSGRDWRAFDAELAARIPALAVALLGDPSFRTSEEWRWGRKGSLAVVVAGPRAGMWFDHEAGEGGVFPDLAARKLGRARGDARDWIAAEMGLAAPRKARRRRTVPDVLPTLAAPATQSAPQAAETQPAPTSPGDLAAPALDPAAARAEEAAARAARIWDRAGPAPEGHPYLAAKAVAPLALRMDPRGHLLVPLQDVDGKIHSLETIAPDGAKRYLAGGAKKGRFTVLDAEPAPLASPSGSLLICEGWATGASLRMATGCMVVAAMDAGNLLPVAEAMRARFPDADLVIVADNDAKPGREANPGVEAARKAALAVDARIAVPDRPGDANDLAAAEGPDAVAALVAAAALIPPPPPTWPEPVLTPDEARAALADAVAAFMDAIPDYWVAAEAFRAAAKDAAANGDPLDFNVIARAALPPLLGLPVEVGLGKSSTARAHVARLLASGALRGRKVVYAVPRHDLGAEQVAAFTALGVRAMLWKGRTAPDPAPGDEERLMCLDPDATFDALEIEHPVEQSCCKVKRGAELHLCAHYRTCGYQRQKPLAKAADVIVCAHDSLFHMKPEAVGVVGLLVIDEAFWRSGLRGLDGKATLTLDGLEPGRTSLVCYDEKGRIDMAATADLVVARERLRKALQVSEPGILRHALLEAVGLTPDACRAAATLERRRLRDAGILPGMSGDERRSRVAAVLPPRGEPWAPPGRCAALWLILAAALEAGHDAAGAELGHAITEAGSVRALTLRWRGRMRTGWADGVPILHLDATLRPELVRNWLPQIDIGAPVAARQPHVRIRQVTGSPTSARALTPGDDAAERDRKAAATHLRDLRAWIALRARQRRGTGAAVDLLVIGQKAAVEALRAAGLPPRVEAAHFNALSGLDRWGGVGGMIVLGRTLPAPGTVELIAMAMTGRRPAPNPEEAGWWYPMAERRLRLSGGRTAPLETEAHADPIAEAIRWSICEGELIQAMGRGRGVNRTSDNPLEIDLLTDVVLPVTVDELLPWSTIRPTRRDLMALSGVVLENAADMAACFPELWPSADAARQDRSRSVTNCYYRDLYNSQMSHSSVEVTWRPAGAGHRARTASFDLARIHDPEAWLVSRLGPLARFDIAAPRDGQAALRARLDALSARLAAAMEAVLAARRAALDAGAARLRAAAPEAGRRSPSPDLREETEA